MTNHELQLPTVWVVAQAIPYEGEQMMGVFTSEAHADAFIASLGDKEGVYADSWTLDAPPETVHYENVDGWHTPIYSTWTPEGVTRRHGKASIRSRR